MSSRFTRVGTFRTLQDAAAAVGADVSRVAGRPATYLPCPVEGSRRRDTGRVCFDDGGRSGRVFNHSAGAYAFWDEDAGTRLTPRERLYRRAAMEKAAAERRKADQRAAKEAAAVAARILSIAMPANGRHPYLSRKCVHPLGQGTLFEAPASAVNGVFAESGYRGRSGGVVRLCMTGRLLIVPMWRSDGIATLQFIDERGRKQFMEKGPAHGAWWLTREPEAYGAAPVIGIAEGVATALSVDLVKGIPCIAAMSCGGFHPVAREWRRRLPSALLLILSDVGNGEEQARRAAQVNGCRFAKPFFTAGLRAAFKAKTGGDKPTDFNDFYIAGGLQ